MATKTPELQDILQALDSLQTRVQELTAAEPPENPQPVPAPAAPSAGSATGLDPELLALLRRSQAELNLLHKPKDFLEYFVKLAKKTGLRLLLLKRWTTGLQVYLEVGVTLPAEARKKRSDGRAPIPTSKTDIFSAVADETTVYSGPVPAKNFPLDLTLMLGRGSRDRQILVVPMPSQNHWNTFLYLDADKATEQAFAVAEVLARFALARMCLAAKGVHQREGRVASILKTERARRVSRQADTPPASVEKASESPAPLTPPAPANRPEGPGEVAETPLQFVNQAQATDRTGWEPDPFRVEAEGGARVDVPAPADPMAVTETVPEPQPPGYQGLETAEDLPAVPDWDSLARAGKKLTPEMVLNHSGELPALPKAACHIMAVIEDPKTTATRLEKALAMDQALTAKVLRIANSPFYGAVREIKTVSEAIVRLGFVAIRNWTLVTAARSVFLAPGAGMLYRKIWKQSVLSAMAGQLVAQAVGRKDPETVFIGGLMQNIGQLVLARTHPEMFQEILMESTNTQKPYHQIERSLLGFDHGELGALLIREWNLSQELEEAVLWHHRFTDEQATSTKVAAMIALGEEIAWCSGGGEPEDKEGSAESELPALSEAAQFLGLTQVRVEELRVQAQQLHIDPHFFN